MCSSSRGRRADRRVIPLDTHKIRALRQKLELTQEQAAKAAGIATLQIWSDIENGRRSNLTIETLERVARALKVKARDLLK